MIIETIETPDNPFPGLRPFQFYESHLFFGRDGLSEELLDKLSQTRFLAVIGTSGSGKSSLVRAGLLPALCGGFMEAGSDWRVAVLRPGNNPICELAQALNDPTVLGATIEEQEETQRLIIESTLRLGSLGLVEIVRQADLPEDENLLIVVDQFEELFRFEPKIKSKLVAASQNGSLSSAHEAKRGATLEKASDSSSNGNGFDSTAAEKYGNEATDFVKLLLEATKQEKVPIYVVITMRSEFLGKCAQFLGLPEAINQGQYLIPRLTREQQREAITKPVAVYKAEITPRLVSQLLNDMGDDPDQLPLMQHALMRTWKKSPVNSDNKKWLDLKHYLEVGGMGKALSKHAESTYNYLSDEQKKIAEKLFKCLTVKDPEGHETRRPTTLKDICEIIEEEEAEVIKIIEDFRSSGRSFLMPPVSEPLKSGSQIDISHESLIRCWERLSGWVDEEARSAWTYCWVANTATALLYGKQKTELLRDRQAEFALNWYEESKPNKAWAERYHDADFEVVKEFLEKSKELRQKEQDARKEIWRKITRRLQTALSLASILFLVAAAIAGWMWWNAREQSKKANEQRNAAEHRSYAAQMAIAQISYDKGDYAAANEKLNWLRSYIESDAKSDLEKKKKFDEFAGFEWFYLWRRSHSGDNDKGALSGTSDQPIYSVALSQSNGQRVAAGTRDGVVKIWNVGDPREPQKLRVSKEGAVSVAFSPQDENVLATGSADGSVRLWNISTLKEIREPFQLPNPEKVVFTVAFSPDGKMLAAGGRTLTETVKEEAAVSLWPISSESSVSDPFSVSIKKKPNSPFDTYSIAFSTLEENKLAVGTSEGVKMFRMVTDKGLKKVTFKELAIPKELTIPDPKDLTPPEGVSAYSVAFSPTNKSILAVGYSNSKLSLWDISKPERITLNAHSKEIKSVAFSRDGNRLATGSSDGSVRIWDTSDKGLKDIKEGQKKANASDKYLSLKPTLKGHAGNINSIAFSPDGKTLISGSHDGTAKIWDTKKLQHIMAPESEGTPLEIHNDATLSLAFAGNGRLVSGSADKSLRLTYIKGLFSDRKHLDEIDLQTLKDLIKNHSKPEPDIQSEVSSVAVAPKSKLLAAGFWEGSVRLWDLSKGQELQGIELSPPLQPANPQERILSLSFSRDEKMLAASASIKDSASRKDKDIVKVWQLESRQLLPVSIAGSCVAFSPTDENILAVGEAESEVKLWNVRTGEMLKRLGDSKHFHTKRVLSVVFSHNGKLLATGSADSTVILWNMETREPIVTLKGHSNAISSLAFSSKDNRLATGSYDGSVKLWDTSDQIWGESQPLELTTLKGSSSIISLAFSASDRTLVAGGGDKNIWLWRGADPEESLAYNRLSNKDQTLAYAVAALDILDKVRNSKAAYAHKKIEKWSAQ
jgi:WD40 repeat protein